MIYQTTNQVYTLGSVYEHQEHCTFVSTVLTPQLTSPLTTDNATERLAEGTHAGVGRRGERLQCDLAARPGTTSLPLKLQTTDCAKCTETHVNCREAITSLYDEKCHWDLRTNYFTAAHPVGWQTLPVAGARAFVKFDLRWGWITYHFFFHRAVESVCQVNNE